MANATKVTLDAKSLRDTTQVLRELEPTVLKSLGKSLRGVVGQLRSAAEAKYRTHGGATPAKGGGYSARVSLGKRKVRVAVMAKTKEAAMFEFAGKRGSKTPQGAGLVKMLNEQYGSPGRVLWAVYDERKAELQAAAVHAVDEAERTANKRLLGRA